MNLFKKLCFVFLGVRIGNNFAIYNSHLQIKIKYKHILTHRILENTIQLTKLLKKLVSIRKREEKAYYYFLLINIR